MVGSARAERPGRSGATVSSSSPAYGWAVAVFWGFGAGKWRVVRGLGCGVSLGAEAHERWGAGALPRACHGGGEVAAAEMAGAAWRGKEGSSAGGNGARGSWGCRMWRWAAAGGLPASLSGGGAALRRGQRKQRAREEEDGSWTYLQNQKSLGVLL